MKNGSVWLRAEAIIRFLEPLVTLQLMMGKDDGDVLPFFRPLITIGARRADRG